MTTQTMFMEPLTITRIFKAPPERLYAAWTEADLMRQWWGPDDVATLALESDPKPGGAWRWQLRHEDGEVMESAGRYLELEPPRLVSFTWKWLDDEDWTNVESTVTVRLSPHLEGTEMVFTHVGFPTEKNWKNHQGGWAMIFDRLAGMVAG